METPTIANMAYASNTSNIDQLLQNWQQQNHQVTNAFAKTLTVLNQEKPKVAQPVRRLVQVFVADANENVPLTESLLYSGEQKLTDLTDQELFFEIDIRAILTSHNEKRIKFPDKAVKERVEYLEPARIRDLKMTVVNIATF